MDDDKNEAKKKAVGWLTGVLTGWGVKECWAKVLAGAVIGALAAMAALSQSGCTVEVGLPYGQSWGVSVELPPTHVTVNPSK